MRAATAILTVAFAGIFVMAAILDAVNAVAIMLGAPPPPITAGEAFLLAIVNVFLAWLLWSGAGGLFPGVRKSWPR